MLHGCTIGDGTLIGIAGRGAQQLGGRQGLPGRRRRRHHREQELPRPLGDLRLAGQGGARGDRGQLDRACARAPRTTSSAAPSTRRTSSGSGSTRDRRARSSRPRAGRPASYETLLGRRAEDGRLQHRQCRADLRGRRVDGAFSRWCSRRRRLDKAARLLERRAVPSERDGDRAVLSLDATHGCRSSSASDRSAPRPRRSAGPTRPRRSLRSTMSSSARPIPSVPSPSMPAGWASTSGSTAAIRNGARGCCSSAAAISWSRSRTT